MTRSARVRFRIQDGTTETQTVELVDDGGTPEVLEDPPGGLPGAWRLAGEDEGVPVYEAATDAASEERARGQDGDRTVLLEDVDADVSEESLFADPAAIRAQRTAGHQRPAR